MHGAKGYSTEETKAFDRSIDGKDMVPLSPRDQIKVDEFDFSSLL